MWNSLNVPTAPPPFLAQRIASGSYNPYVEETAIQRDERERNSRGFRQQQPSQTQYFQHGAQQQSSQQWQQQPQQQHYQHQVYPQTVAVGGSQNSQYQQQMAGFRMPSVQPQLELTPLQQQREYRNEASSFSHPPQQQQLYPQEPLPPPSRSYLPPPNPSAPSLQQTMTTTRTTTSQERQVHRRQEPSPVLTQEELVSRLESFRETRKAQLLRRGVLNLDSAAALAQDVTSGGSGGGGSIDTEKWNQFWGLYFDVAGEMFEEITSLIRRDSVVQRRVVLKNGPRNVPQIFSLAQTFGAIEHVQVGRDETKVQFTTVLASILFRNHVEHDKAFACDRVFTVKTVPFGKRLVLGRDIDIPSAYVEAIFRDLFEASRIDYVPGGYFVMDFKTDTAAAVALHMLQLPFRKTFGLMLTPLENAPSAQLVCKTLEDHVFT